MDVRGPKKTAVWLWWAVDRTSRRVLGWALGDRNTETAQALGAQIPVGPGITYASDFWHSYANIFPPRQHIKGKAHTYSIESKNNQLRHYLARLHRKTHCYSKSLRNLRDSILFILARKLKCPLQKQVTQACVTCRAIWVGEISIPI